MENFVDSEKSYLSSIPENCKTYALYSEALKVNPLVLNQVPDKFINTDLLQTVLKYHPDVYTSLPTKWQNVELDDQTYHDLISYDPMYLEHMPTEKKTRNLCKHAMDLNAQAFKFVPKHLRTPNVLQYALSKCKQQDSKTSNKSTKSTKSTKTTKSTKLPTKQFSCCNGNNQTNDLLNMAGEITKNILGSTQDETTKNIPIFQLLEPMMNAFGNNN